MVFRHTKTSSRGYTLLEILVALSIIGLIFTFGFASFRDFSRRQLLATTKRSLDGNVRIALQKALSGEKPSDPNCDDPNTLTGYNFRVDSATQYSIEAVCTGGLVETRSVELPSEITISIPSPNPVLFKVLGQGTNIPALGTVVLTLTQSTTGSTQTVSIHTSGEIK